MTGWNTKSSASPNPETGNLKDTVARAGLHIAGVGVLAWTVAFWAIVAIILALSNGRVGPYPILTGFLYVWIISTTALFSGVSLSVALSGARTIAVAPGGLRLTTGAGRVHVLPRSGLYRPVLDRGRFGGILYFQDSRSSRQGLFISHAQARIIASLPYYAELPVYPRYARNPRLLAKVEARLRPVE